MSHLSQDAQAPDVQAPDAQAPPPPKPEGVSRQAPRQPAKWDTLFFRLTLLINLVVVVVLSGFAWREDHRAQNNYVHSEIARLGEEAKVLRVARERLQNPKEFQLFLDDFCRQMSSTISPGHHIAVLRESGEVHLRAHERGNPALEKKMAANRDRKQGQFQLEGETYAFASSPSNKRETVVVAQSLTPITHFMADHRRNAIISTVTLVILIFAITSYGLLVWVRNPLRRLVRGVDAIGGEAFGVRIPPTGCADIRYLATRVNEMAGSLENAARLRQEEMRRARRIQQGLLPEIVADTDGSYAIAQRFQPANSVGGDLYDVIQTADGSTILAVLDVTGHGVPAALYTALLRSVLRRCAASSSDLTSIVSAMNVEMGGVSSSGEFATCFLARLDRERNTLEYVSAGHDPALLVRHNGERMELDAEGLLMGVQPDTRYEQQRVRLEPGDRVFLYTDGIHEIFDENEQIFGRLKLSDLLADTHRLPLERQLDAVLECVQAFQGSTSFNDDVTLLALERGRMRQDDAS